MKNEPISSTDSLRDFVYTHARKRGLSLRKIGAALGYNPPYFSDLLNGKKRRSVEFLNALAEYLSLPRVEIYQAAGLLQVSGEEAVRAKIDALMANEPTVRQALDMLVGLEREDMLILASWMIAKSVELIHIRRGMLPGSTSEEEIRAFPDKDVPPAFVNLVAQAVMKYLKFGPDGLSLSPEHDPFGDEEFTDEEIDQLDVDD